VEILTLGRRYPGGGPLVRPIAERQFADALLEHLGRNVDELETFARATATGTTFRGEIERRPEVDLGDPSAAGWTYLVALDEPQLDAVVSVIEPLATRRGMRNRQDPLRYAGESQEEWFDWLLNNYTSLNTERVPHYILIVGGPDRVPFRFQAFLQTVASVGRVAFDTLDQLAAYVEKVVRLEDANKPTAVDEALFFAPDAGPRDATFFSRRYMVEPLAHYANRVCGYEVESSVADTATRARLQEIMHTRRPALLYTASHGVGAIGQPLDVQRRMNGAIVCQEGDGSWHEELFSAADILYDTPCLEGAVVFQFACFGYGTPAESEFAHWLGESVPTAEVEFVSALPNRLLAHPRGPLAYIGHVDAAFLHGFDDPDSPFLLERWHPRINPFARALSSVLETQPVGRALAGMAERYDVLNAILTSVADQQRRGRAPSPGFEERLVSTFITRTDAQNYHVLGDPAVRLRVTTSD
jgi:hypothetical protein